MKMELPLAVSLRHLVFKGEVPGTAYPLDEFRWSPRFPSLVGRQILVLSLINTWATQWFAMAVVLAMGGWGNGAPIASFTVAPDAGSKSTAASA